MLKNSTLTCALAAAVVATSLAACTGNGGGDEPTATAPTSVSTTTAPEQPTTDAPQPTTTYAPEPVETPTGSPRIIKPTASSTFQPDAPGKGNGKVPFQPGEVAVDDFVDAFVKANMAINTVHFALTSTSGGDKEELVFDIEQNDIDKLSAKGTLVSTPADLPPMTQYVIVLPGWRWYSHYDGDVWLNHPGWAPDRLPTSKYLADAFNDSRAHLHLVSYQGIDGDRHKFVVALNCSTAGLSRALPHCVNEDLVMSIWTDDELRVLEYSYTDTTLEPPSTARVEQSRFNEPVTIERPQ